MKNSMCKKAAAGNAQPLLDALRNAKKPWSEGAQIRNTVAPLWSGGPRKDVIRAAMIMSAVKKKPSQYRRLADMLANGGSARRSALGEDQFDNRGYSELRGILASALKGRKENEAWNVAHSAEDKLNEVALNKHGPMQGVPMSAQRLLARVPATYKKPWFEATKEGLVKRKPISHNPRTGSVLTEDQMAGYEAARKRLFDKWTAEDKAAESISSAIGKTSAVIPSIMPLVEEKALAQVAPDIIQKAVGAVTGKPNIPDIILQKAREMSNWEHMKGRLDPIIHGSEDPQALWDSFKEYTKNNMGSLTPWDIQNETDYRNALATWVAHKQAPEGMGGRLAAELLSDVDNVKTSVAYDPAKHVQRLDHEISKLKNEYDEKSSNMLKEIVRLRSGASDAGKAKPVESSTAKALENKPAGEAAHEDKPAKGFVGKVLPYMLLAGVGGATVGLGPTAYRAGKKEWDKHMKKAASDSSNGSLLPPKADAALGLAGVGVGALGVEAYRHGQGLSEAKDKGDKILRDMRSMSEKGLIDAKNKELIGGAGSKIESKNITPDHIRQLLKPMDDYADMVHGVLSRSLMGTDLLHRGMTAGDAAMVRALHPNVANSNIRGVALAAFLNTPDMGSLTKYIPGVAMSPDDVAHTERTLAHMKGMAGDSHATIARELISPMGDPRPGKAEGRLNEWFSEGHPLRGEALGVLDASGKRVSERFEPLIAKMEAILKDPSSSPKLRNQVLARFKMLSSQLTGKAVSDPGALERYAEAVGSVNKLTNVSKALKFGGGAAVIGGAGLAGAGLADYLIGRKNIQKGQGARHA